MRLLFLGDIVGPPGVELVKKPCQRSGNPRQSTA